MRVRRGATSAVVAGLCLLAGAPAAAGAADPTAGTTAMAGVTATAAGSTVAGPTYQMPFPCGQRWTGTTRPRHSPSPLAIDFNRVGDFGDPVAAAAAGTVSRVADLGSRSYGRYVVVDHGDGYTTLYAHLRAVWVSAGQRVDQGALLGAVGASGDASAAHLHFEERLGGTVQTPAFAGAAYVMGTDQASANCPEVPIAGNWTGDAADEVATFRRGPRRALFRLQRPGQRIELLRFGRGTDQPVTGDWDGDGASEVGVFRALTRTFLLRAADGTVTSVRLGGVRDVAVTGDWDGDGRTDLGVWTPATATFRLTSTAGTETVPLGAVGSLPVTGDWNGDGLTDVGVYDPATSTFQLRVVAEDGTVWVASVPFGTAGDLPVSGDWDGDGATDLGTWTPATAVYSLRTASTTARSTATVSTLAFGRPR